MSEPSKTDGNPSQITSGIAFVALILGLFAVQNTVFQPTRPPMESTDRTFSENVRSRLWQDPFQAVEEHRKKKSVKAREAQASLFLPTEIIYTDKEKQTKEFVLKAAPVQQNGKNKLIAAPDPQAKYAYELNGQEPEQVCYQEEVNKRGGLYSDSDLIANSMDELRCQAAIVESSKENKLHVLAVMVPGGPYAEEKEWRLRSRYAVVSALTEMDYAPRDAEHIDYVDFERICKEALRELPPGRNNGKPGDLQEKTRFCHMGPFMPYEWFDNKESGNGSHETILLLWLNSSEFTSIDNPTPLRSLSFLKKQIRSGSENSNFQFDILGPFGSGALNAMYQEMQNTKNRKDGSYYDELSKSVIYTPTATVSQEDLKSNINQLSTNYTNINRLDKSIVRTISKQDKLVDLLLCEMPLRGVIPYRVRNDEDVDVTAEVLSSKCSRSSNEFRLKDSQPWFNPLLKKIGLEDSRSPHHIVLIGEKDTYYSRRLTETFMSKIQKNDGKVLSSIHTFSYLRGLDGITSEAALSDKKEVKNDKGSSENHSNNTENREQMERPVGTSQLDYLLNMAEEIKRLDKRYAHEGGIKAIGITGHDTYDKLLILQALRHKFSGVLFFTTDLDARFFHPSEIKWTRNLLVASPFGLQLNSKFQKQTPPFRDNFQTSFFLTTKLALCDSTLILELGNCGKGLEDKAKKWTDYPRLFEIGNNGAVDISHTPHPLLDITDKSLESSDADERVQKKWPLIAVVTIFLPLLLIVFFTPQNLRVPIFVITFIAIIFIYHIYYFLACCQGIEYASFTDGTSMWPSVLMKILAFILAIGLFILTLKKLSQNHQHIEEIYLLKTTRKINKSIREMLPQWQKKAKNVFFMLFYCLSRDVARKRLRNGLCIDDWRKSFLQEKEKKTEYMPFGILWNKYLILSRKRFTLTRIFIALIITIAVCAAIIRLFQNDVTFYHIRGESNYWVNLLWLGLAFLSYLMLILFVADKAHLSSHFIKLLANPKIEIDWPEEVMKTYQNKYGLPKDVVRYRILLDFINDHCYAPNKFIYYPFFCLFLIVMSRNYYFDNWPTTSFILTVYAFFALLTLISAIRLRAAALYAREQILDKLESNLPSAPVNEICEQDRVNLRSFIGEIRDFKEGIYRPLAYHPMVLNLLVPFSSVGGIYLIEYLV